MNGEAHRPQVRGDRRADLTFTRSAGDQLRVHRVDCDELLKELDAGISHVRRAMVRRAAR
jgi:hypothetical protein